MNTPVRSLLILSLVVAALAFGVPWLTHFADYGLSTALIVIWFSLLIAGIAKYRKRGLWLLTTAPLALFWPVVLVIWASSSDIHLGF